MIGRKKEIALLNKLCESDKSKLVAVYGRRRIGKTYLINQLFTLHKKECTFFSFTGSYNQDTPTQIENFIDQIKLWFNVSPDEKINKWSRAFAFLTTVLRDILKENDKQKIVLFFDEVPWVDRTNRAKFMSSLGYFWNTFCEGKSNFLGILCGSNASWIQDKIVKNEGSFNARLDDTIPMLPFDLSETKDYLINELGFEIDDKSVLELYMIFGGVAKYLSYLDKDKTIEDNIGYIIFSINGRMHNEYNEVFKSLFLTKTQEYNKVMNLLSSKKSGYPTSYIAKSLGLSVGGTISKMLEDLEQCGFIKSIISLDNKGERLFITSDPFCLFYNDWLKKLSKNQISNLPNDYWENKVSSSAYITWSGFAFEMATIINIELYLKARGAKRGLKGIYGWSKKKSNTGEVGAQIDIVVSYDNNQYDIVECKYYNKEFVIDAAFKKNLLNKKEMFIKYGIPVGSKYKIDFVMLTSLGTKRNEFYNELRINKNLVLSDLY